MTAIEWTDETWNPIRASSHEHGNGWHCERVSRGCQNCYAEVINRDRFGTGLAYTRANRERVIISIWGTTLSAPLRWRKPRRIFVCSMTDLFGEWVPFELINWVFAVMALAPQHTYQVLTKRPERMREYLVGRRDWAIPNLWLGVSVEDQVAAESRIPVLLDTPAAVRFLSCEPLLRPVDLRPWLPPALPALDRAISGYRGPDIDWVIVGGESGPGARPCDVGWVRGIARQCRATGTAVFVKQLGAKPAGLIEGRLRHRKGADPAEWPEDLRVREWPR